MKIKITTPNRMILVKNVPIRTPCVIENIKSKHELEFYKAYLRTECAEFEVIDDTTKQESIPEPIVSKSIKKSTATPPSKTEENVDEQSLKAIDEIKTSYEQKIDAIRQEADDKIAQCKQIAIDSIVDMSVKLNKPLVAKLKDLQGEDAENERKSIKSKLEKRSMDSLSDTLSDLQEELSCFKPEADTDKNQRALENALNDKDNSPAESSDNAANDSENTDENSSDTPKSTDEINQGDSGGDKDKDNNTKTSILTSCTRARE